MSGLAEHFPGCHPEDEQAPERPGHVPQQTEPCWHCGTLTPRGCNCWYCEENGYIPPTALHHCPICRRWWAYMTGLNITEITFRPGVSDRNPET